MTVYVDSAYIPFGRMVICHMMADTLDELHEMADRIGINRKWFQNKLGDVPHYDVSKSKRAAAVLNGAQEIENQKVVELIHAWRNKRGPGVS